MLDRYRVGLFAAWHSAAFARQRRMPQLERVMRKFDRRQPDQQTPEQMLAAVKSLAAAWGVKEA